MRWPLGVHLALRGLVHNRVSMIMMLLAVMVGVGFQISNHANLDGYNRELFEQGVTRTTGHLVLTSADTQPIDDLEGLMSSLRRLDMVQDVLARYVHGAVLFRNNAHLPVAITGLDPSQEQVVSGFCDRIVVGGCSSPTKRTVVVGQKIAEKLTLSLGDRVRLVLPYQELGQVHYRKEKFRVAGILEGGGFTATDYGVFVPLSEMYELIGWDDTATSIHVFVDLPDLSDGYATQIQSVAPGLEVRPWSQEGQFVAGAIKGNRTISALSTSMTVLAVWVPVLALLFIHVLSERKQIAILAAMGWTRFGLFGLYLMRAALVAMGGCTLGVGLGLGLCSYFSNHPIFAYQGFVVLPRLSLEAVAVPVLTVFVVTLIGGLIPALRAAQADPSGELKAG